MRSIKHYTVNDFLKWVSSWEPASAPPAPYLYSNAGIGLLSFLITDVTGKTWQEQLDLDIRQQIGMADTVLVPSPKQRQRLAEGHRANGTDAPSWPIFAWYAAGGLRSTALDMLRFGEANLGHQKIDGRPIADELIKAMRLAQAPIYLLPSGKQQQGMAWVTNLGSAEGGASGHDSAIYPEILKDGGTVGFSTVIVINPHKDTAIFIAVNQSQNKPASTGVQIGRHLP